MAAITGTQDFQVVEAEDEAGVLRYFVVPVGKAVAVNDVITPGCWPEYNPGWDYLGRTYAGLPACGTTVPPTDPPPTGAVISSLGHFALITGTQQILKIQTKRTPGVVNNDGIQIRIQTTGGYQPNFSYGKTAYPADNTMNPAPAFTDGAYQYGALIVDPPNSGTEYITVGYLTSAGNVAHILITDKSQTDSDWITQYDSSQGN